MGSRTENKALLLAGIMLMLGMVVRTEAQTLAQPPTSLSPGGGQLVPAAVETVTVDLGWGGDLPAPQQVLVFPDSLFLGDILTVGVDVPQDNSVWPDSLLGPRIPWLVPLVSKRDQRGLGNLDEQDTSTVNDAWPAVSKDNVRLIRKFRVYNLDPFQLQVKEVDSKVIVVKHRAKDQKTMAAVRDPRTLGWWPARWVIISGLLLVLSLLIWSLWRRRKVKKSQSPQRLLPVPAWLDAACQLQELFSCGYVEQGRGRIFLDRLAGIVRTYLAGRYGIGAKEMTAREIETRCLERAYDPEVIRSFTAVIENSDHWRYHPEAPALGDCRTAAGDFFKIMTQVRIMPEFTPVPADFSLRASQAWATIEQELAGGYSAADPRAAGGGE